MAKSKSYSYWVRRRHGRKPYRWFRDVVQSRLPYRGPLLDSPVNRAFANLIGELRGDILLFPVAVRERVVAVLYADGITHPLPDAALHAVAREAGRAYERLILEGKR